MCLMLRAKGINIVKIKYACDGISSMIYRGKITDASNGEDAGVKVTIDNGVTVVRYRRRKDILQLYF